MPRPADDDRVLVEVPRWAVDLFNPAGRAVVILAVTALGGFAALTVAWREVAATLFVPFQVPWLVSAGMSGVALTVTALALLGIHLERRAAAEQHADVDRLTQSVMESADALARWSAPRTTSRRTAPAKKARPRKRAGREIPPE